MSSKLSSHTARAFLFGTALSLVMLGAVACSPKADNSPKLGFVHEQSDLPVDTDITYGRLPNGLRYAVRQNATPSGTASLLMRVDTGSLNETDTTRGLAHFLEHMAFNGSENIPENEMTKRLERFGLAFGADTNASTSFDETIYQLELPSVSEDVLDETMMIMRETAGRLTLAPDAIERERGVILAEKRARNSPAFRSFIDNLDFLLGESGLPDALPIGTEETINSVTAQNFVDFYRAYYRPENTMIVFVGDVQPSEAIEKIEQYFSDWESVGEVGETKLPVPAPQTSPRARVYTDPEIQTSVSVTLIGAPEDYVDTKAERAQGFIDSLGNGLLNRRLGKIARAKGAQFIGASASTSNAYDAAKISSLSVSAQPETWEPALAQAEQALRQALEYGFTQAELNEQLANYQKSLEVAVQTSPTRRTPRLARSILNAFGSETVVTTPQSNLDRYLAMKDTITLEAIQKAFRENWTALDTAPQLYLATPETLEDGEARLEAAFAKSRSVPVEPREADTAGEFAYTDFGPAGEVVDRSEIEDIEVTTLKFANNVRLNVKTTPYEKDVIRIRVRLGEGAIAFPQQARGFRTYVGNMLSLSGLQKHSLDDLRTINAGRSVGAGIGFGSETMLISGSTVPDDLALQMQLMTAYATAPGLRDEAREQYDKYIRSFYPTLDSTPGGVASRDIPRLIRSGDERYGFPPEADLLDVDFDLIRKWLADHIDGSAVEISMVGDITPEQAIAAVAPSFGALPKRAKDFVAPDPKLTKLTFPKSSGRPVKLSHAGDAETSALQMFWPVKGESDVTRRRQISMMVDIFQLRLTEELREVEGASYSPSTDSYTPETYPGYGFVAASLEVSPADIDRMSERVEDIAAEMQRGEIDPDLFDRAMKPALERIETSLENNAYWLNIIDEAQTDPSVMDNHRSRASAYQNMTLEQLKPLAAQIFDPKALYIVQILPEG